MAVNYAEKYSPNVDERFKLGSLTAGIVTMIMTGLVFLPLRCTPFLLLQ